LDQPVQNNDGTVSNSRKQWGP